MNSPKQNFAANIVTAIKKRIAPKYANDENLRPLNPLVTESEIDKTIKRLQFMLNKRNNSN